MTHERIQDGFQSFSENIEKYQGHVLELRGDALHYWTYVFSSGDNGKEKNVGTDISSFHTASSHIGFLILLLPGMVNMSAHSRRSYVSLRALCQFSFSIKESRAS